MVPRGVRVEPGGGESKLTEGARVVLIDDDVGTPGTLTPFFTLAGFDVAAVTSGAAGLAIARAGEVHAIVADFCLPDLTAWTS